MTPRSHCRLTAVLLLAIAGSSWVTPAMALEAGFSGSTATALGFASATVIQPITVSQTADLDFGILTSGPGSTSAVTITAAGSVVSYSGGASQVCGGTCVNPHPASFLVSGEANHSYAISAPASVTITGVSDSGADAPSLIVENLTVATVSRPGAGSSGLLGGDGKDGFTVGGTLELPAALLPARYRASFPVIVTYN